MLDQDVILLNILQNVYYWCRVHIYVFAYVLLAVFILTREIPQHRAI